METIKTWVKKNAEPANSNNIFFPHYQKKWCGQKRDGEQKQISKTP